MDKIFAALFFFWATTSFAQTLQKLDLNQEYRNLSIDGASDLVYALDLEKGRLYQFAAMQSGIDVMLTLRDGTGKTLVEKDSPNGKSGKEIFEFTPDAKMHCTLTVKRFVEESNSDHGIISLYVKRFSDAEMAFRKQGALELQQENQKNILTLDIDHFWQAFDNLKNCKSHYDSITTIQNLYLDRATDGLRDFIERRDFSADEFVQAIQENGDFYQSVREKTLSVKQSEPLIQAVFDSLKTIYANFKPFKVCFAIGEMRTGGTTSQQFVLIGTELTTTGDIAKIPTRIKGIIAHESVHTQQKDRLDSNAVVCNQLYFCLREGAANFIGELTTGATNYNEVNEYGDAHEKELWMAFKSTLCTNNAADWLYNGATVKGKPADLGYYIGYKICQAYYNRHPDKRQAIADIIDMDDPISFLQKSGYDQQAKH